MIRVMIVDDHPLVRRGLSQVLDAVEGIELVGAFAGAREAIDVLIERGPDVVLMDVSMPGMDGIAATREMLRRRPVTRVVMLTSYAEDATVLSALDAGATGYLLKDAEADEVVRGIQAAALGESPLAPRVARVLLGARTSRVPGEPLTARESEILALVGDGLANKQIARRLGISEKTVKSHLTNIFQRLGVSSRTEAALWSRDHGRTS
jgi:DNA-binding NarL/FixJ family response regulator